MGTERLRINTPTPTSNLTPTPTLVVSEPDKLGVDKPTPNLLSYPATVVEGGDLAGLALPANVTVNTSGCASDGSCYWYNFYWAPTHEVVLQGDEPYIRRVHETCHAHQHAVIGRELTPNEYDLHPWYDTVEASSYEAIAGHDWPWKEAFSSQNNLIEDFAEACAWWYVQPADLYALSQARYDWMGENLP